MKLDRFLRQRQGAWDELTRLLADAGRHPERLGPDRIRRLGRLYREIVADLALARRRFPRDPAVAHLEGLAGRARSLVYDVEPRREGIRSFFTTRYWRVVRERPLPLLLAAALLFVPAGLSIAWGVLDPAEAGRFVPAEYRAVTEPRPETAPMPVEVRAAFASQIFTHNIQVSFLAFAGGVVAGLGTALVLVFNGVFLGTITGLAFGSGNGRVFAELVVPHGVLELSCIVVIAAAGLRIGWAIVSPGRRRRSVALVAEGRGAVEIVLGTVPWLVVAGLIEGFITPIHLDVVAATTVGVVAGAAYWALLWWRGGSEDASQELTAAPVPSPAGTP